MGTDYPFPLGECYPLKKCGELVETHKALTRKKKKHILWHNGLDFIGKKSKDFVENDEFEGSGKRNDEEEADTTPI